MQTSVGFIGSFTIVRASRASKFTQNSFVKYIGMLPECCLRLNFNFNFLLVEEYDALAITDKEKTLGEKKKLNTK